MKCPNCGAKLRAVGASDVQPDGKNGLTNKDTCIAVMFTCDNCTHDYKTELLLSPDTELSPIYWG